MAWVGEGVQVQAVPVYEEERWIMGTQSHKECAHDEVCRAMPT